VNNALLNLCLNSYWVRGRKECKWEQCLTSEVPCLKLDWENLFRLLFLLEFLLGKFLGRDKQTVQGPTLYNELCYEIELPGTSNKTDIGKLH
jgi:hypothetical protein